MATHPNRGNATIGRTPKPEEVRAAREMAQLTQTEAADVVHTSCRSWQQWEATEGTPGHRRMHPAFWELFTLKINIKPLDSE